MKLLNCPFCGSVAKIIVTEKDHTNFQIVGCSVKSMICPNPSMVVYKRNGEFDYKYWNKRVNINSGVA